MADSDRGQALHVRACGGEILPTAERAELEAWYAELDAAEAASLSGDVPQSPTNEDLRAQIRVRLAELQTALEGIRRIEDRNQALRRQNEELRRHLVDRGILPA